MDNYDVVAAKMDISEVASRYGHYCDHRDWEAVVGLFTDDGVFDARKVYDKVWTGKAELRDFFNNAPPQVVAHHPTSMFTDVQDAGTAHTLIKMLVVWPRQIFSVDYEWDLVKTGELWRIRRQAIEVVGKARFAEPAPSASSASGAQ
jgi:SnoaL-like protein